MSISTLLVSYSQSDRSWIQNISITFIATDYSTTAAVQRVIHPRSSHGKPRFTAVSCALEYAETETRDKGQEREQHEEINQRKKTRQCRTTHPRDLIIRDRKILQPCANANRHPY